MDETYKFIPPDLAETADDSPKGMVTIAISFEVSERPSRAEADKVITAIVFIVNKLTNGRNLKHAARYKEL